MLIDWTLVPLGDVVEVKHGFAFKGEYFTDEPGPIVMTPGNFHDEGGFKFKSREKYYSGPVPEGYVLSAGDLLVAMTEQKRGLLGSAALIPQAGIFLHNQRLGLVVERAPSKVHRRFLYYLFNAPYVRNQIQATANGAKVRHTSPTRLKNVEVRLPPTSQQVKIAAVLAAYDELIENNLRRIEILEEMAQAVYREWFVNFRYPGHEDVRLVDSPLGPIPEGWEAVRLAVLADVNSESIRPRTAPEEIRYVDIASVSPGSIESVRVLPFSDAPSRARRVVRDGDTIWSTVRPNRRSYALVLDPEPHTIVSTGFAVLRPTAVCWAYLHLATTTTDFSAYLSNHARGAAYPAVNAEDFENALLVLPEAPTLDLFASLVEPMFRLREVLRRQNAHLRSTRDLLLPKLVSGEIDVSDLDIDTDWLVA